MVIGFRRTTNLLRAGALGASLYLSVATARAQGEPAAAALDPAVAHVITGGFWEAGGREGALRLVVVTRCFDHPISRLDVQWLEQAPDSAAPRVVRTALLSAIPDGTWALGPPRLVRTGGEWRAVVEGRDSHTDPMRRGRWVVALGAPGVLRVVRSAPR